MIGETGMRMRRAVPWLLLLLFRVAVTGEGEVRAAAVFVARYAEATTTGDDALSMFCRR